MSSIENIAEKIRALRAKAADAASTEAEAMQAAAMIAKLLTKFDLSEDDLREYEGEGKVGAVRGGYDWHNALLVCWAGIGRLTETSAYKDKQGMIRFIGMPHDVELALYLVAVIVGAADRTWEHVKKAAGNTMSARNSYMQGFSARVNERLNELADQRLSAKTETGTAIAVCKQSAIDEFKAALGLKLVKSRRSGGRLDTKAYGAGRAVADSLNIGRPLAGSGGRTALE